MVGALGTPIGCSTAGPGSRQWSFGIILPPAASPSRQNVQEEPTAEHVSRTLPHYGAEQPGKG